MTISKKRYAFIWDYLDRHAVLVVDPESPEGKKEEAPVMLPREAFKGFKLIGDGDDIEVRGEMKKDAYRGWSDIRLWIPETPASGDVQLACMDRMHGLS